MIRKITGKSKTNKLILLKSSNGKIDTSKKEISNVLGENFQQNSSSSNYSETFQNIKQEKEKEKLDFSSLNQEKYRPPSTGALEIGGLPPLWQCLPVTLATHLMGMGKSPTKQRWPP